jgi:hypothetical protein
MKINAKLSDHLKLSGGTLSRIHDRYIDQEEGSGRIADLAMKPMPRSDHPKLSNEIRFSPHANGIVILDIKGGELFSSNAVGARIIALLSENKSLNEIADRIGEEFHASAETVKADLTDFIQRLKTRGLLRE